MALQKLRALGIMHIEYSQPPAGEDITGLKDDINTAGAAINILSSPAYKKIFPSRQEKPADWKFSAKHIADLEKRLQQLDAYSLILNSAIAEWEPWGDFAPEEIEKIKANNIYIGLYQVPVKEIKDIPAGVILKEMFRRAGVTRCVIISEKKPELSFKEIIPPKMSLEKMRIRLYEDQRMRELIVDDIMRYLVNLEALVGVKKDLEKHLELQEALRGMGMQGNIAYLTGYIPFDQARNLEQAAKQEKWGLLLQDPAEEDLPPVLLRNPHWIRLIEPVMKMLGIAPGYRELDVSPAFIVFFSIFFGILIGDAGYGLAYLLLTFWFQKKKGNSGNADIFYLLYILSSCAIIWGVLTGTFFGQGWLAARGIKPLVPALNNPGIMQRLCFLIGALHLSIAHLWRGLLKFPHLSCLADLGWIAVLWVSFFLAGALILGEAFPAFGLPMAICGIILVLFFTEPRKNLLKGLGAGFISVTFGLSFMSAFTDVVSYVRLFAVGLAGVAIADTTNAMAAGLGSGIAGLSAGVLIKVFGHVLNIVLGPIAILVHGVRLNVLEFGLNHTGLTWSGAAYKPLQESS
ncbi:MAG: hypothetical protein PHG40_05055 [Candidatus Omnitrophica bacterium]|nr:hypothetical protein [Candidatus Omnitrophota bacterium]